MKRGGWPSAGFTEHVSPEKLQNTRKFPEAALRACGDKERILKSNPAYPANVIPNQRTPTGKRALMKGGTDASLKQAILPTEDDVKKMFPKCCEN